MTRFRLIAVFLFVVASTQACPTTADEQEEWSVKLIRWAPRFDSSDSPKRFDIRVRIEDEPALRVAVRVARDPQHGDAMYVWDYSDGTPLTIAMAKQLAAYDAIGGRVLHCKPSAFGFVCESDADGVRCQWSALSQDDEGNFPTQIKVDLLPLLAKLSIERIDVQNDVVVIAGSTPKGHQVNVTVDPRSDHPLRTVELSMRDGGRTVVEFVFDPDLPEDFFRFPHLDGIREKIEVVEFFNLTKEAYLQFALQEYFRALYGRFAIYDLEIRDRAARALGPLDWEAAARRDEENSRILRQWIPDLPTAVSKEQPAVAP